MNIETILTELVRERDRINGAIAALGGGSVGNGKKPRRPRAPLSEETKQRMRDSWAKRKRAAARKAPKG